MKARIMPKNGTVPITTSSTFTSSEQLATTKRTTPSGGVSCPSSTRMTTKTPNQIGSTPRAVNDGKITGTMMAIIPRRSEEHTSELQSLMRISYAVFCLKKKKNTQRTADKILTSPKIAEATENKKQT